MTEDDIDTQPWNEVPVKEPVLTALDAFLAEQHARDCKRHQEIAGLLRDYTAKVSSFTDSLSGLEARVEVAERLCQKNSERLEIVLTKLGLGEGS